MILLWSAKIADVPYPISSSVWGFVCLVGWFFFPVSVCMHPHALTHPFTYMWTYMCVTAIDQRMICDLSSLLLLHGFQGLNSSHQASATSYVYLLSHPVGPLPCFLEDLLCRSQLSRRGILWRSNADCDDHSQLILFGNSPKILQNVLATPGGQLDYTWN